jgi:hypothetical protein
VTDPLDGLLRAAPAPAGGADAPALLAALARAAAALARLDQASAGHPLLPALLHRARLDAVRRQAAADGFLIDPWHLAALVEGLRPRRLGGARSITEAGGLFEAGRTALAYHGWLSAPGSDEEGEVCAALAALRDGPGAGVPLLDAAAGARRWLGRGGGRPPLRAALVRFWGQGRVLRAPLPLTGAAALRADADRDPRAWTPAFLRALADEAEAALDLLFDLERGWLGARGAVAGRHRRHSRAPAAVDLLAAAPLLSATTLARALGVSVKSACAILDGLVRGGVVIEVTGRSARRLFGLRGLAPLAAAAAPPRRPEPGRGRGRPRHPRAEEVTPPPPPLAPLGPVERRAFDYADLAEAMAAVEEAIRRARRTLDGMAGGGAAAEAPGGRDAPGDGRAHVPAGPDDEWPGPAASGGDEGARARDP